jgi:replicative DNA helicase
MSQRNQEDFIFDPPLISTKTVESVKRAQQNPTALSLGLPALNEFIMAQKSKVIGILGDTSQGKTSLMRKIASEMAKQVDVKNNEIGLYITWEDNIEDFGLVDFAEISLVPIASMYNGTITEAEFNRMLKASAVRAESPLWLAGHSETSGTRPMLTMTDIWAICENLTVKQGRKIRFIMFDYIQRINREDMRKEGETRMQYSAVMDSIKNIALSYQVCVFVGSQVRRDQVEKGKWRQPQAHWAMETSNFEHSCDGMLSVWMPSKSNLAIVCKKKKALMARRYSLQKN